MMNNAKFRIRHVDKYNWPKWSRVVCDTMRQTLPEALWHADQHFLYIWAEGNNIARLATIDGHFVGIVFGKKDGKPEHIGELPNGCRLAQLRNLVVAKEHQNKGIGFKLRMDFIEQARKARQNAVMSFCIPGASLHNALKSGASKMEVVPNAMGSGVTFVSTLLFL